MNAQLYPKKLRGLVVSRLLLSRGVASIDPGRDLAGHSGAALMNDINCVADRFVTIDDQRAIDLATGDTVRLVVTPSGTRDELVAWTGACDARYLQPSADGECLVDYGGCGPASRFEAWQDGAAVACLAHIERPVDRALAELFEGTCSRSRMVCVFGPPGSGKSSLLVRLARAARLQGFVPFAGHLLRTPIANVIEGRSVYLINDRAGADVRVLAELAVRSSRAHVVICAATEDVPGLPSVRMPPLAETPHVRFGKRRNIVTVISRAAEHAPVYGTASPAAIPWPVPAEVQALTRQVEDAVRCLDEGRHAPGERALRRAIGALTRRGEWASAARGSMALAASLLKRGRPRDARSVVEAARESCRKAPGDGLLVTAATLSGVALVDLGRLEEAETVLSAAHTVAGHSDDRSALPPVALALARCRFWRGQYVDAGDALRLLVDADLGDIERVRVAIMRARLAIARDDVASAVGLCADAVTRAAASGSQRLVAEAACAMAFAHLQAGDLAALRQDVVLSVSAAKASRDPLRQLRVQLLLGEQLRRLNARDEAIRVFSRARRIPSSALPRILKCRRDLLADLLAPDADAAAVLSRHVAATGCHALVLFVSKAERGHGRPGAPPSPTDTVIEVLRVCQTATDESTTLSLVCEHVQRQIHATALGFFGMEAAGPARLASRGPRLDSVTARRAAETGVFIAPHQLDERVEAAMPVRYGGAIVGVLGMRWVIGSVPDADHVATVAAMATTAAAPIVAAALAARRRADGSAGSGLVGVSSLIVDVRKAVERAASAPFAVLVEGESGSGKELVARAIHRGGVRRDRPFVTLNCAALPDDLVESELFGHARGAFTGAVGERAGVFEDAHTGTLFLDEVGELSPRAQAKVLRVIQEGELRRVGENTSRRVDVRVVSATNRDLRAEAAAGRFRLDLLYRLDVVRVVVPPLRDRREDIPLLVEQIWREAAARYGSQATLGPAVLAALVRYDWPGNVRELQNVLASLVVRAGRRGVVPVAALPPVFEEPRAVEACRLDCARRAFDANFVRAALVRCGGRRSQAAGELGLTRQGLTKLMARLGIADGAL